MCIVHEHWYNICDRSQCKHTWHVPPEHCNILWQFRVYYTLYISVFYTLCITLYYTLYISLQAQLTRGCKFCDSSVCISLRAQLSQHFRESTALYISLLVICNVSAKSSYQDISHVKESAVFTTRVLEPFGHWNLVHVGPEEGLAWKRRGP